MTLQETQAGIADALRSVAAAIPDLQVYGYWNDNPTPPSLDVYPGDPFQDGAGFGTDQSQAFFTVRARVGMADNQAGQQLLLRMLDVQDPASVQQALEAADAGTVVTEGVSGFRQYPEDSGATERMLGCEWRVQTFL